MIKMITILLVDDDLKLRNLLKKYLVEQSFEVKTAENAKMAEMALKNNTFDIMVLDMMMPGENGLDFCKRLRAMNNTLPIIMLSARGEDIDKILGLEVGADDYLSKPFNPRELVARIKAILRRPNLSSANNTTKLKCCQVGKYSFNLVKRHLQYDKTTISLTSGEYDLLRIFVENKSIPLSRDKLMRLLHAKEFNIFDRSIDVLVSRLRKIVEEDASKPEIIKTIWGVGYEFVGEIGETEEKNET